MKNQTIFRASVHTLEVPVRTLGVPVHKLGATALTLATVLLFSGALAPAAAQLPQASARALGLGYNMTATARGFAAIANNPAGLAMHDSPGFSLAIPALEAEAGIGPVTLSDLAEWEGRRLSDAVRQQWLQNVTASGGQSGALGLGVTAFAASVGSIGIQISSRAGGNVDLGPDAVELLLYGNAGRTGTPGDFQLEGSSVDGFVLSTAAVSYGFRASPSLRLGVTGTYTIGTGLVVGRDQGSTWTSDPLEAQVDFPMLFPQSEDFQFDNGTGLGLDVGAIWVGSGVTVGATVQNIFNTFEWNVDGFSYVPGRAFFDLGNADSDFDELPASGAPQSLLDAMAELTIKPTYAVGVELVPNSFLSLQADLRKRVSGGLAFGPDFHAGVSAELRALSFLPLRAHVAKVTDGTQLGGGASLVLGPVNLSGALALRTGAATDATLAMVTLSFGAN